MVSIREVERVIKNNNGQVQWEMAAKNRLAYNIETLMIMLADRTEQVRSRNRVTSENVDVVFMDLLGEITRRGE